MSIIDDSSVSIELAPGDADADPATFAGTTRNAEAPLRVVTLAGLAALVASLGIDARREEPAPYTFRAPGPPDLPGLPEPDRKIRWDGARVDARRPPPFIVRLDDLDPRGCRSAGCRTLDRCLCACRRCRRECAARKGPRA